jgi:hypothetical protein
VWVELVEQGEGILHEAVVVEEIGLFEEVYSSRKTFNTLK